MVVYLLWGESTALAFSTSCVPTQRFFGKDLALFSTFSPREGETATDSLKKLLQRQKEEVEETERLIKRIETAHSRQVGLDQDDIIDASNDEQLSTAASILSGFDYGFRSRSEGPTLTEIQTQNPAFVGYGPPANIVALGSQQFMRNLNAMNGEYKDEEDMVLSPRQKELQAKLETLTLDSDKIWERELAAGPIEAPWVIKLPYLVLCFLLDRVFEEKYVPHRFFLLETVARMPYFSYIGM